MHARVHTLARTHTQSHLYIIWKLPYRLFSFPRYMLLTEERLWRSSDDVAAGATVVTRYYAANASITMWRFEHPTTCSSWLLCHACTHAGENMKSVSPNTQPSTISHRLQCTTGWTSRVWIHTNHDKSDGASCLCRRIIDLGFITNTPDRIGSPTAAIPPWVSGIASRPGERWATRKTGSS